MKKITSLKELREVMGTNDAVWLLLYKNGSEQSHCALENFEKVSVDTGDAFLCTTDVSTVRDIHPEFGISTVPTLIKIEKGNLKKTIKGCYGPEQFKAVIEEQSFVSAAAGKNKAQKNVVVYTTPTCTWCTTVKRHLDENGVRYREVNVAADAKAAEAMVKKSGQQGVPQTEINGQIVVGFDKTKINSLLGIN